jgi:hypothetical protein
MGESQSGLFRQPWWAGLVCRACLDGEAGAMPMVIDDVSRDQQQRLAALMVERARNDGLFLVGPDGVLTGLTIESHRDRPERRAG